MRVGWDLDGVWFNFGDSVKRYLEATDQAEVWKSGSTDTPFWNFYEDWGWTGKQFVEFCNAGADAGYIFSGPTRDDAASAMNRVKAEGHQNIIITDRAFGATPAVPQTITRLWLAEHGFEYCGLHCSADKTIVPTDVFVEDKLENYDRLVEAGVEVYLVDRPWNQQHRDGRNRIASVQNYADIVVAKSLLSMV